MRLEDSSDCQQLQLIVVQQSVQKHLLGSGEDVYSVLVFTSEHTLKFCQPV